MDEKKRLLIMGIVIVLLGGLLMWEQGAAKRRKAARRVQIAVEQTAQATPAAAKSATPANPSSAATTGVEAFLGGAGPRDELALQRQLERMPLAWGRDPFRLIARGSTSQGGLLTFRGVSQTESGRGYAIINESIVRVGDRIDGNEVVGMTESSVVLERDGRQFILQLESSE